MNSMYMYFFRFDKWCHSLWSVQWGGRIRSLPCARNNDIVILLLDVAVGLKRIYNSKYPATVRPKHLKELFLFETA